MVSIVVDQTVKFDSLSEAIGQFHTFSNWKRYIYGAEITWK